MTAAAVLYSPRVRTALLLAEEAHRGQRRKGSDAPHIVHPVAVAAALAGAGAGEDLVCAGYLHDVVEDTAWDGARLAAAVGPRVAALVLAVTEEKVDAAGAPIAWEVRKERQLAHLAGTDDPEVFALKAADLLVNLTDIALDQAAEGDAVWDRFRRGREAQLAYYGAAAEAVLPRVALPALAQALREAAAAVARLGPAQKVPGTS